MVAVFVWPLLSLLVRSSISALHKSRLHGSQMGDDYGYDVPPGVTLHDCVQGDNWSLSGSSGSLFATSELAQLHTEISRHAFQSETSFDLPLSSQTLFFMARGQLLGGVLHVMTSPNQAQDSTKVHIVIRYDRPELRDMTKAHLLSRHEGENGVGIFTPVWHRFPGNGYSLNYEITIILPELSKDSAPLVIRNFETDISNGGHLLEDLNGKVTFNSIYLKGSNAAIKVNSLTAIKGTIHTSNSTIHGKFNTTGQLVFETSHSSIHVAVGLESDKDGSSPALKASTSNGNLQADVSLLSASGSGGSFDVSVKTSNAPVHVNFPSSPVDSKLNLDIKTSNNPAIVSLNPTYEGSFSLRTSSLFSPTVSRRPGVEDPTGQGRSLTVVCKTGKKKYAVSGDIYWGDKKTTNGTLDVRTSNANVTLEV